MKRLKMYYVFPLKRALRESPFELGWEAMHLGNELSGWVGRRRCRWSLHSGADGFSWMEEYRDATIWRAGSGQYVACYCYTGGRIASGTLRHCALAIQRMA